jgi:glycosyltransferase involved in cell wall biosynthesis
LHPQKNLDVMLAAWVEVARRSDAHLILLGDGPDRARLIALAQALGIADRVHVPGPVDDPSEYLRAADLFVLPSIAEGMSNSLLEAMATGLPCIASAIGGNTDLLEAGPSGLLVPPDDPQGWAGAILRVLEDPDLSRSLGRSALTLINERYAMPVVVDRYVRLYRSLCPTSG